MDTAEVWKGLRSALLGDATLVALLGSADAIYREFPGVKVDYPVITLRVSDLNPIKSASYTGEYVPDVQFNIFVVNPYDFDAIFARLESAWTIPQAEPEGLETDNYRITSLRWLRPIEVGKVRDLVSNDHVTQFAIEAVLRVIKKSG